MVSISDQTLLKVRHDIRRHLKRSQYEDLLIEKGVYSRNSLRGDDGHFAVMGLDQFIEETLLDRMNNRQILEALLEEGILSTETQQALIDDGVNFGNMGLVATSSNSRNKTHSNKSASRPSAQEKRNVSTARRKDKDGKAMEITGDEFALQLETWKAELAQDVISHYHAGNRERGELAFDRWKERFTRFLNEHYPNEASCFTQEMRHFGYVIRPGESPYETFMREDGKKCLAFIDDLAEEARKGRLMEPQTKSPKSSRKLKSSPKVFLSYARADSKSARRLYNDLKTAGTDVWFDQESLLGGQRWKAAIGQAIRNSHFFIALLSTKSVNKRGYVQKELKEALDVWDEYPPSQIFLIPVRLDEYAPADERLHDLQWINMFPDWDEGLARIVKAIESQIIKN